MSSTDKKKTIGKDFFKGAASVITGAAGDYISDAMPNSSAIFSEIKSDASSAISAISGAPQAVSKKVRQIKSQFGIKNITAWFKGESNSFDDVDSEGLGFDLPDVPDISGNDALEGKSQLYEQQQHDDANTNKLAKAITDSAMHSFEGQINLSASITTAIDTQTTAMNEGFKLVNENLAKILEVVTKNTATMIETTVAVSHAQERSGAENMLGNGRFSLKDYKNTILSNMDHTQLGMVKAMLPMITNFLGDPSSLMTMFNPKEVAKMGVKAGLDFGLGKLAPNLKSNLQVIDKSINDLVLSTLVKWGQDNSMGLKGQVKRLFGVRSDREEFTENRRSALEVKTVPFDSIAHEAISNAIPGYLRKILVAVGGEDLIYDYRSRKFRSNAAMKQEFRNASASNGGLSYASNDLQKVFGNDDFGNMMYDMMLTKMGAEGDWANTLETFKSQGGFKKYMQEMLEMNGEITLNKRERKRIQQMNDRYEQLAQHGKPADEINTQVATQNARRNRNMQSYIDTMDKYNIDVTEFSADADSDLRTILERNGRLTDKQRRSARNDLRDQASGVHTNLGDTDSLMGVDYTNRALYEIFRRLNKGINVFQVGKAKVREKPFEEWGDDYLKPPKSYRPKIVKGVQSIATGDNANLMKSMLDDTGPNLLENQVDENGNVENLTGGERTLRWLKSRGGSLGKALATGNAQQVTSALGGMIKDVGSVGGKALNKAFGNVTGYLKHKFTGAEYSYQDTDADGNHITVKVAKNEKGGVLGFIGDRFKESFDKVKEKGAGWFKQVSQWFKFDDGKAEKKDGQAASKRQKFIAASVGALAGGGILGGPVGLIMGALAGSMIGSLDIGGKIKETLFGRDEQGNPTGVLSKLSDKVIDPIKYQFQKTAHSLGTMLKKNVLGPLSDLGQAIKDRITASAESKFGKVFQAIGKIILAPFKGIGKLLLNIVKLPVNLIGGVTRGVAGATTGLFGAVTEGLAKKVAKKSTATHEVPVLDRDGNPKLDENGNPITKTLSAAEYIKYRKKNRNAELKETDKKFDNFKTWQSNERAARAKRRKAFKSYTSEEVTQMAAEGSKDTADNTSKILSETEEQTKELSAVGKSLSNIEHEATHTDGTHSLQTHDQGLHDLLKQIIEIISGMGGDESAAKKQVEKALHVDDKHAEIAGDKLPDTNKEAKSILEGAKPPDSATGTKSGLIITEDGIFHSNPAVRGRKFTEEEKIQRAEHEADLADLLGGRTGPLDLSEMNELMRRDSERADLRRMKKHREEHPDSLLYTDEQISKLEETIAGYYHYTPEEKTNESAIGSTSSITDSEEPDENTKEPKNIVNRNDDNQAAESESTKDLANNMIGAVSSVASGDGNVSEVEADSINTVIDEASSSNPSKGKLKNAFNKLFKKKEANKKEDGEKKQSFLSKLLGGIGGVFSTGLNGVKSFFSGGFGSIIKNLAGIGILVGGVNWLKNKGDGSILQGISTVAGEVKTWWGDHKEDIFKVFKGIGEWWGDHKEDVGKIFKGIGDFFVDSWNNLIKPLWTDVIKPLIPTAFDLIKALLPAIENLAKFTADVIKKIFGGVTGDEDPTKAGMDAVTYKADVDLDSPMALYGYGTASHVATDGAGDQITNSYAQSYIDDKNQRLIYDQVGKSGYYAWQERRHNAKAESNLQKAIDAEEAGNTRNSEKYMNKAVKEEKKANAASDKMNAQKGTALHGMAKNVAKGAISMGLSSGAGGLASSIAQGLGVDEEHAAMVGNITTMGVSAAITTSTVTSAMTGKKGFIDKIVDGLEKLINNIAKKIKGGDAFKDMPFTDQMFAKVDDFISNFLKKIPVVKTLMSKMDDLMEKIALRLGFATAKEAAAAVTAGIAIAVSALNGLLNGICGVEHLFGVLPDIATPLMITISAGIKTIFGALEAIPVVGTIISILDLLDTIIASVFGKGLTQLLAEFLLGLFGEGEKLKEEQAAFQAELDYYNKKYGTDLNTSTFNDKINDTAWYETLWNGKQDYDENGHLRFDEAGGNINHGMEQLFVGGERAYYKNDDGTVRKDAQGNAIQLQDAHGHVIKKDMKWGDYVGNWFGDVGRFFGGGDTYETDENGVALLDENGNKIVKSHEGNFFEKWNDFFQGIGANISQFVHKIPEAFGKIGGSFSTLAGKIGEGDVGALWSVSSNTDKNDPMGGFSNIIDTVAKVIFTIPTAITGVGKSIWNFFVYLGSNISQAVRGMGQNILSVFGAIGNGDVGALWNIGNNTNTDNMFYGFTSALTVGAKVIATIPTAITGVGKTIFNFFKSIGEAIPQAFSATFENIVGMVANIPSGDLEALWSSEDKNDSENMLSGFTGVINTVGKVIYTVPTAIFWVGHKIGEFFTGIGTAVANGFGIIMENADTIREKAFAGDVSGLWELPYEEDENNPIGGVMEAIFTIQKVVHTPMAAIFWVGNMIGSFFRSIGDSIANDNRKYQFAISSIEAAAEEGDVGAVWSVPYTAGTSFVSPFFYIGVIISKVFNTVKAVLNGVFGSILGFFGIKVDKADVDKTSVGNRDRYAIDSKGNVVETEKGSNKIINIVYEAGSDEAKAAKDSGNFRELGKGGPMSGGIGGPDEDNSSTSTTSTQTTGGNPLSKAAYTTSSFGPRTDPKDSMHYGIDLVAADGDSSNVQVGSRFAGTVSKVVSNVPDYAKATKNGDKWEYNYSYNEGGNQVWIDTKDGYRIKSMHLAANSIPANIKEGSYVNVGDKLGIMGTTGWSTGNHLHYQIEKDGKAIDPSGSVYSGSTLSSFRDTSGGKTQQADQSSDTMTSDNWFSVLLTKLSEAGTSLINSLTGGLLGAQDNEDADGNSISGEYVNSYSGELNSEAAEIWNYLKSKGWSDEAVSAVLGCWTCESGVKAKTIEYDYCKSSEYPTASTDGKFPYDAVINSNQLMDQWCQYLFDMYDRCGIPISREGYKATDGHYYPGIGYAGWTGDNTRQMLNYAREKKAAWDDPKFQLDWMEHQLKDIQYFLNLNTFEKLSKATSPEEATTIFATDFEGCPKSWQDKRIANARAIYNQYRGKDKISTGDVDEVSAIADKAFKDDFFKDFDQYMREVGDKQTGGNSTARTEFTKYTYANPDNYAKWKAGHEFYQQVNSAYGAGASYYLASDAAKKAKEEFVADWMARYETYKNTHGGIGGPMNEERPIADINDIMHNTFDADPKNGGKGGPSKLSATNNIPTDFTKDSWLSARKKRQGGKGGPSCINPATCMASDIPKPPRSGGKGGDNLSKPMASTRLGKGGDNYTPPTANQKCNVNLDEIISLLGSMLTELKSIAVSNNSSSDYLAEINQKEFVDQGLRDSINSLNKATKKSSTPIKSSGGSARTVASLARPT